MNNYKRSDIDNLSKLINSLSAIFLSKSHPHLVIRNLDLFQKVNKPEADLILDNINDFLNVYKEALISNLTNMEIDAIDHINARCLLSEYLGKDSGISYEGDEKLNEIAQSQFRAVLDGGKK